MPTNLKSRSGARVSGSPVVPETEMDPSEVVVPDPVPPPRRKGGDWAEDWNDPSKLRQMSPIWPLLWLTVPFVLVIVYELFKTR